MPLYRSRCQPRHASRQSSSNWTTFSRMFQLPRARLMSPNLPLRILHLTARAQLDRRCSSHTDWAVFQMAPQLHLFFPFYKILRNPKQASSIFLSPLDCGFQRFPLRLLLTIEARVTTPRESPSWTFFLPSPPLLCAVLKSFFVLPSTGQATCRRRPRPSPLHTSRSPKNAPLHPHHLCNVCPHCPA